jgi:AraC-like DNA-binding protein
MSRFRLCRLFKEHFGESLVTYVNRIRIRIALELLGNHHLTVSEIAYFVGFKTVGHFERVFKDVHGLCPREYRRKFLSPQGNDSHE